MNVNTNNAIEISKFFNDSSSRTSQLVSGLQKHSARPNDKRTINKKFSMRFMAKLLGITSTRVKQLITKEEIVCSAYKKNKSHLKFTQDEVLTNLGLRGVLPKKTNGKPITISMSQFKGGTGKTTAATNLAAFLSLCGYRVTFIDLDPQRSATEQLWPENPEYLPHLSLGDTVYQVLSPTIKKEDRKTLSDISLQTAWTNLKLVPACLMQDKLNTEMTIVANQISSNQKVVEDLQDIIGNMSEISSKDALLIVGNVKEEMDKKTRESGYRHWEALDNEIKKLEDVDIVIVDCQPSINPMTLNAVYAADLLCMPVTASMLDVSSYDQFLNSMANQFKGIGEISGSKYIIPRILISNYDGLVLDNADGDLYDQLNNSTASTKSVANKDTLIRTFMQSNLGEYLINQPILRSDATKESTNHFKTVFELDLDELDSEGKRKHTVAPTTLKRSTDSFENFGLEIRELIESI
jgi:chromosome partitioning protein